MFGDGRVNDFSAIVAEDDGNVEQPKRRARYDKRVDGGDTLGLIEQEATPGWRRCISSSHHVLGDCRLADLDAELEELSVNPGRAPERVGGVHLPNQITSLAIHRRPSCSRTPAPKEVEALTVPLDDCGRLDQHHRIHTTAAIIG
jgi:hypothetical protein